MIVPLASACPTHRRADRANHTPPRRVGGERERRSSVAQRDVAGVPSEAIRSSRLQPGSAIHVAPSVALAAVASESGTRDAALWAALHGPSITAPSDGDVGAAGFPSVPADHNVPSAAGGAHIAKPATRSDRGGESLPAPRPRTTALAGRNHAWPSGPTAALSTQRNVDPAATGTAAGGRAADRGTRPALDP